MILSLERRVQQFVARFPLRTFGFVWKRLKRLKSIHSGKQLLRGSDFLCHILYDRQKAYVAGISNRLVESCCFTI